MIINLGVRISFQTNLGSFSADNILHNIRVTINSLYTMYRFVSI